MCFEILIKQIPPGSNFDTSTHITMKPEPAGGSTGALLGLQGNGPNSTHALMDQIRVS